MTFESENKELLKKMSSLPSPRVLPYMKVQPFPPSQLTRKALTHMILDILDIVGGVDTCGNFTRDTLWKLYNKLREDIKWKR